MIFKLRTSSGTVTWATFDVISQFKVVLSGKSQQLLNATKPSDGTISNITDGLVYKKIGNYILKFALKRGHFFL